MQPLLGDDSHRQSLQALICMDRVYFVKNSHGESSVLMLVQYSQLEACAVAQFNLDQTAGPCLSENGCSSIAGTCCVLRRKRGILGIHERNRNSKTVRCESKEVAETVSAEYVAFSGYPTQRACSCCREALAEMCSYTVCNTFWSLLFLIL